jgi:diguanylate cyclase (GGDEF)-like protein
MPGHDHRYQQRSGQGRWRQLAAGIARMNVLSAPPVASASAPFTVELISAERATRSWLRLQFPAALETRFETDTRRARIWNIRLTVPLGLFFYILFTDADRWILPDLGWVPISVRLCLVLPTGLFAMWMCGWATDRAREFFISVAISATLLFPLGFMLCSHAPLAPYTSLVVLLVSMHGNITMRVRFHWACIFSIITVAGMAFVLLCRPDYSPGIRSMIAIATITCVTFGIVANNQLEHAERRSFLHAMLDTIRAEQLSLDKEALSQLSLVDPLTGIANRRAFDRRLIELVRRARAGGPPFALLLVDVDHFKAYNDHYGHPGGDACLVRVGQLLRDSTGRRQDLVARYGGEEFAILLSDCDAEDGLRIGQALCRTIGDAGIEHLNRSDGEVFVSVSIGVAAGALPGTSCNADDIVAAADRNLYTAKHEGRNRAFGS